MATGTLALAGLLMGLAGGPHCAAMCGAASAGVVRLVRLPPSGAAAMPAVSAPGAIAFFHLGRTLAYAVAGAGAALAMQGVATAGQHVAALRPAWLLLHALLLGWALMLAVAGRQPLWAGRAGRSLAARLHPRLHGPAGVLAGGLLWVLLPCGLLYSALMLAALASGPGEGALVMLGFAGQWRLAGRGALAVAPIARPRRRPATGLGHPRRRLAAGGRGSAGAVDGSAATNRALVRVAARPRLSPAAPSTACMPPAHTAGWRTGA